MVTTKNIMDSLVSVSQFNKGQASKIFDKVKDGGQVVVLKNNMPSAVIISPEEYKRLSEVEEDYDLLIEAATRLQNGGRTLSETEVMKMLGITEEDVESAEDVIIE